MRPQSQSAVHSRACCVPLHLAVSLLPAPTLPLHRLLVLVDVQPAGVGFSYSNTTSDYTVGDARAAADVLAFLTQFTKFFPQFASQPLFISGESYGGHYGELTEAEAEHAAAALLWPWSRAARAGGRRRPGPAASCGATAPAFPLPSLSSPLTHRLFPMPTDPCPSRFPSAPPAVPSISRAIVEALLADPSLNLNYKGFLVGNAWTWSQLDNTGAVQQWVSHGMISNDTATGILATCNMSSVGPLFREALAAGSIASAEGDAHQLFETAEGGHVITSVGNALGFKPRHPVLRVGPNGAGASWVLPTYQAQDCNYWSNLATTQMGNTDIYYVTGDVCVSGEKEAAPASAADVRRSLLKGGARKQAQKAKKHAKKQSTSAAAVVDAAGAVGAWPDSNNAAGCAASYDPCNDTPTAAYLNRADVQAALHVMPATIPGGSWVGCSSLVNYSYSDLLASMLPTYQYLLANWPQGRYLVFSGDMDGIGESPWTS